MTNTTYYFKSKFGTFLLGFIFGGLGLHRFYLGNHLAGFAYLLATFIGLVAAPELVVLVAFVALLDAFSMLFRSPLYFRRVLTVSEVV